MSHNVPNLGRFSVFSFQTINRLSFRALMVTVHGDASLCGGKVHFHFNGKWIWHLHGRLYVCVSIVAGSSIMPSDGHSETSREIGLIPNFHKNRVFR